MSELDMGLTVTLLKRHKCGKRGKKKGGGGNKTVKGLQKIREGGGKISRGKASSREVEYKEEKVQ